MFDSPALDATPLPFISQRDMLGYSELGGGLKNLHSLCSLFKKLQFPSKQRGSLMKRSSSSAEPDVLNVATY